MRTVAMTYGRTV